MSKDTRLTVAAKPKNSTLCASWFFGGPHQWSNGIARCTVKRRQQPPYQHKFSTHHEWGSDGRCVHCRKTRAELKPKPSMKDRCCNCGLTRHDVQLLAKLDLQPRLEAQDFGHPPPQAKPSRAKPLKAKRPTKLRLAIDNTKEAGWPFPVSAHTEGNG